MSPTSSPVLGSSAELAIKANCVATVSIRSGTPIESKLLARSGMVLICSSKISSVIRSEGTVWGSLGSVVSKKPITSSGVSPSTQISSFSQEARSTRSRVITMESGLFFMQQYGKREGALSPSASKVQHFPRGGFGETYLWVARG